MINKPRTAQSTQAGHYTYELRSKEPFVINGETLLNTYADLYRNNGPETPFRLFRSCASQEVAENYGFTARQFAEVVNPQAQPLATTENVQTAAAGYAPEATKRAQALLGSTTSLLVTFALFDRLPELLAVRLTEERTGYENMPEGVISHGITRELAEAVEDACAALLANPTPAAISPQLALDIVNQVFAILYREGNATNPEKEWDAETVEHVASVFHGWQLVPQEEKPFASFTLTR